MYYMCLDIRQDYSARRLAQKYLQIVDPDYYEWETHILFDDAFELGDNDEEEQIVNSDDSKYVWMVTSKAPNPPFFFTLRLTSSSRSSCQ